MTIEHMNDRYMTRMDSSEGNVSDMTEIQRAIVADHIASLEREAAALRAERVRDHARATARVNDQASRRVRLGRWLVSVGEAIGGTTAPIGRSLTTDDGPCDEGPTTLSRAA